MTAPPFGERITSHPSEYWEAIDVSSEDFEFGARRPRALFIGAAGDVNVVGIDGSTVLFINVQDGCILPVMPAAVLTLNTTAGSIVALY